MKSISNKLKFLVLGFFLAPLFTNAQNTTYQLDTTKSVLHWKCANHFGTIKYSSGELKFIDNQIISGKFDADMSSIKDLDIEYDLMQKTLVNILKSPEFFDTESYPFSSLWIDKSQRNPDNTFKIQADLHVLGGDVCVEFDAKITPTDDNNLQIETSKFIVNRTKWGIRLYSPSYPNDENNPDEFLVPDEVELGAELYFYPVDED